MAGQTYTARMVAREVSKRLGRDVDAKRVRAWVRDNVDAYDDDGYTAHVYDHATFTRIVTAMVTRGRAARPTAASTGRSGKSKSKTAPTAPKTAPTARAMGSGPVTRVKATTAPVTVTAAPTVKS